MSLVCKYNSAQPPKTQEAVNERWRQVMLERYPNGEDVLACLNMLWLYFKDDPSAYHPGFSIFYSMIHATAFMGINWSNWYRQMKPIGHYVDTMRTYGVEENPSTGRLEVRSPLRFQHALWIARQTGRCPPSTFQKRFSDPDCQPLDPVEPGDLPPVGWRERTRRNRPHIVAGRLKPGASPMAIVKEMDRVGLHQYTFDERRKRWFNERSGQKGPQKAVPTLARMPVERATLPQERFSTLARVWIAGNANRAG